MSDFPRREFLKSIVAGSLGIGVTGASPAASSSRYSVPFVRSGRQATQPNIVWIIAEDMGPDLGCYGTEAVYTPHIDALAEEGMQFDQAFAVSPVCSPNRSALHTGCWPRSIDAHNHRSNRSDDPTPPNPLERVRTMPTLLREAGYYTGLIEDLGASAKMDWNFDPLGTPWDTRSWSDVRAAARDQPFFAEFNFPDTHRDFHGVGAVDPAAVALPPYYPDHKVVRNRWASYLEAVQLVDRHVGRVLRALDASGVREETVVIFTTDHGRAFPRAKQWPYDSGLHVPLIVSWPEAYSAPASYQTGRSDRLVNHIDLTATTLSLAQAGPSEGVQGRVFLGTDSDPERDYTVGTRDRMDGTIFEIKSVRGKRFRYVRNAMAERPFFQWNGYKMAQYPEIWLMLRLHLDGKLNDAQARLMRRSRPEEELYDLQNDPHEVRNLVGEAAHQSKLEEMRVALEEWVEQTPVKHPGPEKVATVRAAQKEMFSDSYIKAWRQYKRQYRIPEGPRETVRLYRPTGRSKEEGLSWDVVHPIANDFALE